MSLDQADSLDIDVTVVGGGISGLTLNYYLKTLNQKSILLESASEIGGVIKTEKVSQYFLENGPQSFQYTAELKVLIESLNLDEELIFASENCKKRYLAFPNKKEPLIALPSSFSSFLFGGLFSFSNIKSLYKEYTSKHFPKSLNDISLQELFYERFGKDLTDQVLAAPFVGIWAASIKDLSARSVLPNVFDSFVRGESVLKSLFLTKKNKRIKPPFKIANFKEGLITLTIELEKICKNSIFTNEEITGFEHRDNFWLITTNKRFIRSKSLVFAIPAYEIKNLFEKFHLPEDKVDLIKKVSCHLDLVKYSPIGILQVLVDKVDIARYLNAFGVLIPPAQSEGLLGVIFSDTVFPLHTLDGHALLTCFCGGAIKPEFSDVNKQEIETQILNQVKELFSLKDPIKVLAKNYWPKGIPLYSPNHFQLVESLELVEKELPLFYFNSNITKGVSLPARIKNSMLLASRIALEQTLYK